ncbi:MAG: hypothetical protein IT371_26680 [Deltaproteobacteria bacterium]|nr:hypothetical protein [Deltaproteobacteria bacterium]
MATAQTAPAATGKDSHEDFDAFLKEAIHAYYERSGKKNKGSFIALIIASGEMGSLAVDSFKSGSGMKKMALGAAGVVALRLGLKYALSGPLGALLLSATAASLITYFVRNRGEIAGKISRYRQLVRELRGSFDKLQSDCRDGRLTAEQRNLMLDGLQMRFLADLDA